MRSWNIIIDSTIFICFGCFTRLVNFLGGSCCIDEILKVSTRNWGKINIMLIVFLIILLGGGEISFFFFFLTLTHTTHSSGD